MTKTRALSVVGIMSGTSIDGVDFVLCQVSNKKSLGPKRCQLKDMASAPFPQALAERLRAAARHELKVDQLALLHHDLGRFYAGALKSIAKKKKWKIDLIGLHGQTVFHSGGKATLQIGEASYLNVEIGKPVVCNFRSLDIALGGQGAPLATLFHRDILAPLAKSRKGIAIQNLGGIGNVSYFSGKQALSFDTGPANMLIDLAVRKLTAGKLEFDEEGTMAASGIFKPGVVDSWLKFDYFRQKPPKSCGREEFGEALLAQLLKDLSGESVVDQIAALTEFTAASVADQYRRFLKPLPEVLIACGGGAKNSTLLKRIQFRLPEVRVVTSESLGWPSSAIEGAAFAWLAAHHVWGEVSNVPQATGAKAGGVLGQLLY